MYQGHQELRTIIDDLLEKMEPDDCACFCVGGRRAEDEKCKFQCPGPDEPGSLCYVIQGDDERPVEVIAKEIEVQLNGRVQ